MDFYISMALAVLFQVLKDKGLYEKLRPAFQKLAAVIEANEASLQLELRTRPPVKR